jgi:hypothetical protein
MIDNENDPELNGKYLGTVTKDFIQVCDVLKEAAYQLKARKISDYPIFPISKVNLPVGQLLLAKEQKNTAWNYNFSFLDEFVQRGLVDKENEENFKQNYKDPEEFCCLFVVDEEFTKFMYIPYPND